MEDSFELTWDHPGGVVQNEEVICEMETEIMAGQTEEFQQEVTQNGQQVVNQENIVYLTDDNVLVMQQPNNQNFQNQFIEEVVTEQWVDESCPQEIVVGSEEAVVGSEQQMAEDLEIPLPTDQDEYTAARPYPCDFCSRRFRKKANLMNHMVAHQTDRPHGCNLCGARYIRKCDLLNHLKIHAFAPETSGIDDEENQDLMDDQELGKYSRKQRMRYVKKKKRPKIKEEFDFESEETAGSSRSYKYVDQDMRLMDVMENNVKYSDYLSEEPQQQQQHVGNVHPKEIRFPVVDERKPFVCQHCGVAFAREKALASHSRIHGGDSPFECRKCGELFWDADLMKDHVRLKHNSDNTVFEEIEDEDDADYSEDDNKYGTFYCPTCGLSFHRQDNLRRHQRVHIKEEDMEEEVVGSSSFEHSGNLDYDGHVCNVCGESFAEALDLLAHAEIHARGLAQNEHRCMRCGEQGEDDQAVAAHVQSAHGDELPPNTCVLCGRTCRDRRTLLKHAWEHSKEKSFVCSKCAKTFHNKARLKRHMLSHRSKAVTCDVCGEEFPDGRSLMNHRHSHSSVSGRQFPCRECGKTFGSRSSQQIHIRIHTGERPYGCRFCWKAFADGGTLRKHERIHTGEKPYACAVCPRAFNQRVVLREHIRSHHSGPDPKYTHSMTPYCCSVCSDMFATSQDLIVHLIHHCDMNTAMKRQPQVGPRKYKRRRKLKPHELELLSNRVEEGLMEPEEERFTESDEEEQRKKVVRKPKKSPLKQTPVVEDNWAELYTTSSQVTLENNTSSTFLNNITKVSPSSGLKNKKKIKPDAVQPPSRPKMIHTQKTRVPLEPGEDGKMRHKMKTLVTRTQPTEVKLLNAERIRPRTKNVSYHVVTSDKLPLATFPEDATAVDNLLKDEQQEIHEEIVQDEHHLYVDEKQEPSDDVSGGGSNGMSSSSASYMERVDATPEIASEQIVESEITTIPVPTGMIKIERRSMRARANKINNLKPGRTIIGPGSKVVRLVKGGMIVSKKQRKGEVEPEPENILPDFEVPATRRRGGVVVKQEYDTEISGGGGGAGSCGVEVVKQEMIDTSPLHELAEISMQHAQNIFRCEMCSEIFSDRAQLLVHVPIHI